MTKNSNIERLYTERNDTRRIDDTSLVTHVSGILKMLDNVLSMPELSKSELRGFYEYQLQHDFEYWKKIHDYSAFVGVFEKGVYEYLTALKFGKELFGDEFSLSNLGDLRICSFAERIPGIREFDMVFGHLLRNRYPLTFLPRRGRHSDDALESAR